MIPSGGLLAAVGTEAEATAGRVFRCLTNGPVHSVALHAALGGEVNVTWLAEVAQSDKGQILLSHQ